VIWDVGNSAIIHAEVTLARRLGQLLLAGVAFGRDGEPTRDPAAALAGAFAAWAGTRAPAWASSCSCLASWRDRRRSPRDLAGFGFVMVATRPDLLGPAETFRDNVSAYAQAVRTGRPVAGGDVVRMPFDRSRQDRQRRLASDRIDILDLLFEQLPLCVPKT
jgi:delta1-piperideine-2-carboxylate reductase